MKSTFPLLKPILYSIILIGFSLNAQNTEKKSKVTPLQIRYEIENNIVLLKNENNLIPIRNLEKTKIAVISSLPKNNAFEKMLDKYADISHFTGSSLSENELFKKLEAFDVVILGYVPSDKTRGLKHLFKLNNLVFVYFDREQNISITKLSTNSDNILYTTDTKTITLKYTAQIIFGGIRAKGKLKKNILLGFKQGEGLKTKENIRLKYTIPEEVGLNSHTIKRRVDSIMQNGIKNNAFPGAQLLVAKNNKVIFHEAYGFHTYDKKQKVQLEDVYDMASVTKITASLPALMKLHDIKKIALDKPFSTYWKPWQKKKNKRLLTFREILAHQAGLTPYIIFLNDLLKKGKLKKRYVRSVSKSGFDLQAYDNIFIKNKFKKKIYRKITKSKVSSEKKYKYSGLTFLLYPEMVQQLTNTTFNSYLQHNFYAPLGAKTLGFNPKTKSFPNNIVPTEFDTIFRKTLTKGWVHDENAALLGGISGNAGIFSTANDMAKLMQMYVQYGTYGGKRYLSEATIKEFARVQYPDNDNRRGLGFDKPLLNNAELSLADAYPAPEASSDSFGHAGFTGTFVWVDPKNQLVFIFLSNRVYPTRTNRNLYKLNIRAALHQVFHQAVLPKKK
ncbi:MAG: serine hydrolase [Cellulophaga sp.]